MWRLYDIVSKDAQFEVLFVPDGRDPDLLLGRILSDSQHSREYKCKWAWANESAWWRNCLHIYTARACPRSVHFCMLKLLYLKYNTFHLYLSWNIYFYFTLCNFYIYLLSLLWNVIIASHYNTALSALEQTVMYSWLDKLFVVMALTMSLDYKYSIKEFWISQFKKPWSIIFIAKLMAVARKSQRRIVLN